MPSDADIRGRYHIRLRQVLLSGVRETNSQSSQSSQDDMKCEFMRGRGCKKEVKGQAYLYVQCGFLHKQYLNYLYPNAQSGTVLIGGEDSYLT